MKLTYGSVCSGIEAASVAWHPLGMRAAWFAEIEKFPSAVLAHRWPEVQNLGDMTQLARQVLLEQIPAPPVLVGGTPCQDFSVAGMRAGLAGKRGALTIKFVELADAIDHVRPAGDECVVVWENVPGVLSDKANAFGCFLGALVGESDALQPSGGKWTNAGCVYGPRRTAAWRVLDAQYFGLAQRRRRVFVVASARRGFDPAAVLFEPEGVRRDTPPRRGEGQDLAGRAPFGPALQCGCGTILELSVGPWGCPNCEGDEGPAVEVTAGIPAFGGENQSGSLFQAGALNAHGLRNDFATETFCVAPTITGGGRKGGGYSCDDIPLTAATLDASYGRLQGCSGQDLNHGHSHLIAVHGTQDPCVQIDQAHTLGRNNGQENAVLAFHENQRAEVTTHDVACTLKGHGGKPGQGYAAAMIGPAVRRLTPRECERLQGFPDDYTLIPWRGKPADECPDGPRYKAIGNSKAVPVVRWIGQRLLQQLQ
ncbi:MULTISPECIES: DNA cytosine methyltransferase [unclassified Pseudomonas]|jgi:DNA (cytosine-5)-methyltransferase 1|uniref:DNA cytosine methyltransferase n=1 Tax=unclassified Pseudomonas TaxID=196821 RepID=UPI000DA96880|nr:MULTISPECIES: DNA cytosine methyltransferase [unclassified Pseudomonas]MDW3712903.1 DNA cytosine methyltransferase [Pseudomonas sp. 2023EL-01195]PZE12733.1 DNA cytosine methyltransferase [Pseudomonas sp. 57B-090624]